MGITKLSKQYEIGHIDNSYRIQFIISNKLIL